MKGWFVCMLLAATLQVQAAQKVEKLSMSFVKVKAGQFMMGCSKNDVECTKDERPLHQVRITKAFEIGRYEVKASEWYDVMGGQKGAVREFPMVDVSWTEIQAFLQKLNDRHDGFHYRLPTEAEWEYAARGGSDTAYPVPGDLGAWHGANANGSVHKVGGKARNFYGLYDIGGNAAEWVQDWFDPTYYERAPGDDPSGPEGGSVRVVRGGSIATPSRETRSSARAYLPPASHNSVTGFRVVRTPEN